MSQTIDLTFTNASPTLVLIPTDPKDAPAEFVNVLVGAPGPAFEGATDEVPGFTTDPVFYYLLASN